MVEKYILIIHGISFLAIGIDLIDFKNNEIKFIINGENVTFKTDKRMELPREYVAIFVINVLAEGDGCPEQNHFCQG